MAAAAGLFLSRALLSMATVGMGICAILVVVGRFGQFRRQSVLVIASVMVLWMGLSIFYTPAQLTGQYWRELSFKMSVLAFLIPLALVPLSVRQVLGVLWVFGACGVAVALGTFVHYLANYDEINELIEKSKPIPIITGYFHISFSLMLGFVALALALAYFYGRMGRGWAGHHKWGLLGLAAVAFVLMHVVAARTGLVAMYAGFMVGVLAYYAIGKRAWFTSGAVLLSLALIAILAIAYVRPLHNRYENTKTDIMVYFNGENPNWWSGAMRMKALENSWYIAREHPWLGVGMASLDTEVQAMYAKRGTLLLPENRKNPHNQFANMAVTAGIPGLVLLLLLFGVLIYRSIHTRHWLLMAVVAQFLVAFQFEAFLERQFGACFFGLSVGLLLNAGFLRGAGQK